MDNIIEKDICETSSQSFTDYAIETITNRALADVRDGLKPVTRRVVYDMYELGLKPNKPYKKSARVVGDTMGKYHPHGDSSIYGALVTSAQSFREQLPIIDGYGNFGTIDDSAAAMRYCVTGDTLINTNQGLIPIKDIVKDSELNSDNPIDIVIQSKGNTTNKASMFFNSGKHNIIEVVLKNGMSIKGSYNHPILTIQKTTNDLPQLVWKTLDKINTNDKIVVNKKYSVFSNNDLISKDEIQTFVQECLDEKVIPNVILQSSLNIQKEFLRYLYENNAIISILKDKRKNIKLIILSYSSKSIELLRTLQIMLLQFGICSSIKKCKEDNYKLTFSGENYINLFDKQIGFISEKKTTILKEYCKNTKNINDIYNKEYSILSVKEINRLEKDIVYSIRVDSECHSFIGNGFVNHNTESRLTEYGMYLLDGLDEDAVDFVDNYDATEKEPEVLPAFVPNMLVNGDFGIAVGYAPNIPPHNYSELIDGIVYQIDNPKATTKDLMKFVKGPDFPEGAIIDPSEIESCYDTGKGSIAMRAKIAIEPLPLGKQQLVVTEVPYLVSKEKLIKDIAKALDDDEFLLDDVRDETDKNGTRIIIAFDKGANIEKALDVLFKKTQLQCNFSYNFVALYDKAPVTFSLKQYFEVFIEDKINIIKRRYNYKLNKERQELEKLDAILAALAKIDEVIAILKSSKTTKIAKEKLCKLLGVSEYGAQVIIDMRLSSLINTEVIDIKTRQKLAKNNIKEYETLVKSDKNLKTKLKTILIETKDKFSSPRKTKIKKFEKIEMKVQEEEFTLQAIGKKYKKVSSNYNGSRGICLKTKSSSIITAFLKNGDVIRYLGNQIKDEEPCEIVGLVNDENKDNIFFITSDGLVKQSSFEEYQKLQQGKYLPALKLNEKQTVIACFSCTEKDEIFIETKQGFVIRFSVSEVRPTGRIAGGMCGIKLNDKDFVVNAGLITKNIPQYKYKVQKRAGKGCLKK